MLLIWARLIYRRAEAAMLVYLIRNIKKIEATRSTFIFARLFEISKRFAIDNINIVEVSLMCWKSINK